MQILRGLEEWGRERTLGVFSRVLSTPETSAAQAGEFLAEGSSAKILLIGIYQNMGQFLCTTPLIRAFNISWPNVSLHFLGNPVNATAARANLHLDRVWIWKKSELGKWSEQIRALRKEKFDMALLLTTERPSATGVLMARAIGARWLAGYVPSIQGSWAEDASALCHIRIPFQNEKNEVDKFLGFARAFGVPEAGRQPEFVPSPDDETAAESFLSALHLPVNKPLIGLFIGGKVDRSDRLWPVSHFAQLADRLKASGYEVIVLSPPPPTGKSNTFQSGEYLRLEEFRKAVKGDCPVFQETSLGRVGAFIKRLDLLVCPDGGILHLAAAVGTPTLALFFSTDPDVWRHDVRQAILDGRGKPSSELSVDQVAQEVQHFVKTSL